MNITKNAVAVAIAALAVSLTMPAAVQAEDYSAHDAAIAKASMIPTRLAGVTAGLGLGVPMATLRATVEKAGSYSEQISNALPDAGSPANKAYSTILAVPGAVLAGLIDGPYYGCKNAIDIGFDHPFTADSFSLGDADITR